MSRVALFTCESVKSLETYAQEAHPNEAGGVLIGVFGDGRPWVSRVIRIIPAHRPWPDRFVIPPGLTPAIVAEQRNRDCRLGYLGDWHTHPADVAASGTDRASLIRVAADPQAGVVHPLLVVVRLHAGAWDLDVLETHGREHLTCDVRVTGPLGREIRPANRRG